MTLVSSLAKGSFKTTPKHALTIPHNTTAAEKHENGHLPGRWNIATMGVTTLLSIFSNKIQKFLYHIFISSIQKWTKLSTVRVQCIFK
jgi:hypothetical protein